MFAAKFGWTCWPFSPQNPTFSCVVPSNCSELFVPMYVFNFRHSRCFRFLNPECQPPYITPVSDVSGFRFLHHHTSHVARISQRDPVWVKRWCCGNKRREEDKEASSETGWGWGIKPCFPCEFHNTWQIDHRICEVSVFTGNSLKWDFFAGDGGRCPSGSVTHDSQRIILSAPKLEQIRKVFSGIHVWNALVCYFRIGSVWTYFCFQIYSASLFLQDKVLESDWKQWAPVEKSQKLPDPPFPESIWE